MTDQSGAVATVIGASIAAGVAFLGLVVSKEQKTSEFRQAWIDALRDDLATYLSRINSAYDAARAGFKERSELWKVVREDMVSITGASTRVMLRLNSDEKPSAAILETIKRIDALFDPGAHPEKPQQIDDLQIRLVSEGRIVLKEEWERVKRGERIFMISKWASLTVIVLAVSALIWMALPLIGAKLGLFR
ncbi:MAG TPA: hypothetical protein VK819_15805 [Acidobacteriaceae bacterium]|jgi:hypothetical protein|nr:hypothetical protein [Acidobacteriaceae bacterium]